MMEDDVEDEVNAEGDHLEEVGETAPDAVRLVEEAAPAVMDRRVDGRMGERLGDVAGEEADGEGDEHNGDALVHVMTADVDDVRKDDGRPATARLSTRRLADEDDHGDVEGGDESDGDEFDDRHTNPLTANIEESTDNKRLNCKTYM